MSRDYRPPAIRGVELKSKPLPGVQYQDLPAAAAPAPAPAEITLEETRVPFGPHKGKMLINLLNEHPGYLLHLRDDAFTDHEAFELKVEEFCKKYEHRLARATGGAAASTLWCASLVAVKREGTNAVVTPANAVFEAIDFASAEALAKQKARQEFPDSECRVAVYNIPLAQLRRALKAEQSGGGR